jgi:uncharacterized OsmC-like protein
MTRTTDLRAAQERVIDVLRRKPSAAFSTIKGSARVEGGLSCTYRQGERSAPMDMGTPLGGTGEAPTPGFYFRAAVSGCIAIGIKLTAVRDGLELESVTVDVEMDFDDGAMLGLGSNPASPLATRINIALESREPADALRGLVDRALAADPYFLALRDAQQVTVSVR